MASPPAMVLSADNAYSGQRKPPFFRYGLSSKHSMPPSLPAAGGMERVPLERWTAFWSSLGPIVRSVQVFDSIYNTLTIALLVGIVLVLLAYIATSFVDALQFASFLAIALVLSFAFGAWSGHTRKKQLESIRNLCREEEERSFRSYGFSLKCEYEWGIATDGSSVTNNNDGGAVGFFLYFIPYTNSNNSNHHHLVASFAAAADNDDSNDVQQNGYLRIELYNAAPFSCTWSPISLASLASYSAALPPGFEVMLDDDNCWTGFWSEMCVISKQCLDAYRLLVATQLAYVGIIVAMVMQVFNPQNATADGAILLLFLGFLFACFYASCKLSSVMNRRLLLVQESAARFAQRGVYMEYRRLYKFHWCSGAYGCHYVYLFPPVVPQTQTTTTTEFVVPEEGESSTKPDDDLGIV